MLSLRGIVINSSGTLLSRLLGLFKNITINFYYGLADTFWGAFQIINTFRIFVGEGAINNILIPNYKTLKEQDDNLLKYFIIKIFLFVLLLSFIFSILLFIFSYPISKLILPGFSEDKIKETSESIKIMSFSILAISLQSLLAAIQIAKYNRFIGFAYAPVIANITTISLIFTLNYIGILSISWAVLLGSLGMVLFQFLFFIPEIKKPKTKLKIKEIFEIDEYTKKFIIGFFSITLLALITQINGIVSRFFGSFFEGVVAATSNAFILIQAPIGMFSVAISVVGLNALSEYISKNDIQKFRDTSSQGIRLLNLIIVPLTIIMVVFSYDIAKVVYKDIPGIILGSEGKYSSYALKITQELFSIYAIATYFVSLNSLLTRISFARRDTKIPLINSLVNLLVNTLSNIVVFLTLKTYLGIPFSFLLGNIASVIHILSIEYKNISQKKIILEEYLKITGASIVSSILVYFSFESVLNILNLKYTYLTSFILVILKLFLSLSITTALIYKLKVETFTDILSRILKSLK